MREKDENKKLAIYEAAIELINEIGFAETSMSKIAKKAKLSASTIYVYFENKEDMLNKIYLIAKHKMSEEILKGVDQDMPFDVFLKVLYRNAIGFLDPYRRYHLFIEQFANSPLINNFSRGEAESMFMPIYIIFEKAKQDKIIKDYPIELLLAYSIMPLLHLARTHISGDFVIDEDRFNKALDLAKSSIMI